MQDVSSTIIQIRELRNEIRWSQQRTLIELFASSFGVFFWMGGSLLEKSVYGLRFVGVALIFPLVVNIAMWTLWAVHGAIFSRLEVRDFYFSPADDMSRAVYMEYDAVRYAYHRIRYIERYINFLTAVQFILMASIFAYLLFHGF
jgi:hypothetical protein